MKVTSEALADMIRSSGAKKVDIYTEMGISRATLDRWIKPGNDHMIDVFKVMQIASIISANADDFFPGIYDSVRQISQPVADNNRSAYLHSLIEKIAVNATPDDVQRLKDEVTLLINENDRYSKHLSQIMDTVRGN